MYTRRETKSKEGSMLGVKTEGRIHTVWMSITCSRFLE